MNTKMIRQTLAVAAAAAIALPLQAHAYDVVNSNTPVNGLILSNTIDSSNSMAEKFSVSAATQIDSVLAYVLSNDVAGDTGKTFSIALYADYGNLPALNLGQLFQATATYAADGWNGVTGLNWTLNAGSYWLALEASADSNSATYLQAPNGALPVAQAVAYYAGGPSYVGTSLSESFGLHVTAVTPAVPEPGSLMLMLTSLGILGLTTRRRR
ncbi:MAG: PEP-CTERM sorting domain-containing protein [Aquabacterium sp.]|uniref:PEP-CTERM sorting domain-containing protein n=1 Tax=Aquabacterium sp. TaxID=1872578 RepID=UPI00121B1445|nr:PEP-CTERM sorting domain-containing protein [Aquabacterium sp.]TAK96490.1 MAG: PEP-CTERM sorting domain-containing protein [Aquabacterium sp.]